MLVAKGLKSILVSIICIMLLSSTTSYGREKVEGSASVSVMSSYVWRGFQLSSDDPSIQPAVTVSYKGVSLGFWSNYFDKDLSETDITLDYSGSFKNLGYSLGYIFYALDGADDTQEVYIGASYDIAGFSPSLFTYWDFDETDSVYIAFSVGHDFKVNEELRVSPGLSISYYFYDSFEDDWQNLELSLSASIPAGPLTIEPSIAYSFGLYTGNFGDVDDEVYGGVTVSLSF